MKDMSFTDQRMRQILERLGKSRILIVGDIMIDEYLHGSVERISPEAPVPVVDIASTRLLLGGGANVAANIRALGDEPVLLGVVGDDDAAAKLRQLLQERGIGADALITDRSRQTTIKTRVLAHSQQIVRVDREDRHALDQQAEDAVFERVVALLPTISGVIISDYGKGMITKSLLERMIAEINKQGKFVAVDPKDANFFNYKKVSLVTPNHHEAGFAFGRRIRSEADLLEVGSGLLKRLEARSLLITRGSEGMSLFESGQPPVHIPTFARKVFDVTGAGDTVISVFVSAVCAGGTLVEASVISNAAAGYTVGEIGTATISKEQLAEELAHHVSAGNLQMVRR